MRVGSYVRCPIDINHNEYFRDYVIGQVLESDEILDEVLVEFHDIYDMNRHFDHVPDIRKFKKTEIDHCDIKVGAIAIYNNQFACRILGIKENSENIKQYYAIKEGRENLEEDEILILDEDKLFVQYDDGEYNPINQIINFELQNPVWYKGRRKISEIKNVIENSAEGIELLLGSRVYLFQHQMNTIVKAINEDPCRIMLADEVGLGKTIEACVILKGLSKRKDNLKAIIIVPESLIKQWEMELSYKFWENPDIWEGSMEYNSNIMLLALEDLEEFKKTENIIDYDLMIVDEVHRLLKDEGKYKNILSFSKKIRNLLLLSATPIEQRISEYLDLLILLDPVKYEKMGVKSFREIIAKNKDIKDIMHMLIRDLDLYIEDELGDIYIEDLEEINYILNDKLLERMIEKIDLDSSDLGLANIKKCIAYVSNTYEVEQNIFRNRRMEIEDKLAERSKETIYYEMSTSSEGLGEIEVYNSIERYLREDENIAKIKEMLAAFFSSPWALENYILENLEEDKKAKEILSLNEIWMQRTIQELENLEYYEANPDEIKSRMLLAIDYLDENYLDEKIVVFTSSTETAKKTEKYLKKKIGEEAVVGFNKDIKREEREENVDRFQGEEMCRYLVCDKLGGEGRNFQVADIIFHMDVPWSAIELEQRIGRLDRIGRDIDKKVISLSMVCQDSVEEDMYNLWGEKGLNIYNESLSGIEIAIEDIEKEINESLRADILYGLKNSHERIANDIRKMKQEVDRERSYDLSKKIDISENEKNRRIIERFDPKHSKELEDSMVFWASLVGLNHRKQILDGETVITFNPNRFSINSARKTLYKAPDTGEALKRGKRSNVLEGTFSTDLAVTREDLIYFAPGDEIYESIMKNAKKSYRGRSCALAFKGDINWTGLVFVWNINFNNKYLLEEGIIDSEVFNYEEYLIIEQFESYHPLRKSSQDVEEGEVKRNIDEYINELDFDREEVHFGKRELQPRFYHREMEGFNSNIEYFKSNFGENAWEKMLLGRYESSKKSAINFARQNLDIKEINRKFDDIIYSLKTKHDYYGDDYYKLNISDLNLQKELVIKGLENPKIELDSIAYITIVEDDYSGR